MIKHIVVTALTLLLMTISAGAAYEPIEQQEAAREIAEQARSLGLPESDPIIKRAQELWWEAEERKAWDLDLIAAAIYHEAWGGCSDRHRELVGAVIMNRVHSDVWPDSVYEVLTQPGQYAVNPKSKIWWRAKEDKAIWSACQNIAKRIIEDGVSAPYNVVFQSNFKQGNGVYEVHKTSYSTTYFCTGKA